VVLEIIHPSMLSCFFIPVQCSSSLTYLHEFGGCLSVINFIDRIHILDLLISWYDVFHDDFLSLLWNILFPFFSLSQVFLSLKLTGFCFLSHPFVFKLDVFHFTFVNRISHLDSSESLFKSLFGFFIFIIHFFDSVFNS
jgi:hypothetical protein